ncbi:MAG: hypothetical protein A2020_00580 [Lentisphaerae bacterium GWF2_45_14]|nr:MAG: hypothetical protein A2020_00580 [Lentisphaerae bacterium GWF2_45_14]
MSYLIYTDTTGVKKIKLQKEDRISIGRSKANDLAFPGHGKISRKHTLIYYYPQKDSFVVADAGSTNGTLMNGNKVASPIILSDGDEIIVGDIRIRYSETDNIENVSKKIVDSFRTFSAEHLSEIETTKTVERLDEDKLGGPLQSYSYKLNLMQGTVIKNFSILRKLGMDDSASVYLARAEGEEKAVALKIFDKDMSDNIVGQEDFLSSFKKASSFQHISFVRYIDCGIHKGHPYYAMSYMPNVSLKIRIFKTAPLTELDAIDMISVIGTGLSYAFNQHGIIHCNLKPSNILFNSSDEIEISDYGFSEWASRHISGGVSAASPWYISPEQILGENISWHSDIYSLGIIFFQMLTGVLPFHSMEEEEILSMHIEEPFPMPNERNPNIKIHDETTEFIMRMTAKDPGKRFLSWSEFLNASQKLYEKLENYEIIEPFIPKKSAALLSSHTLTRSRIQKQKLK